MGCPCRPVSYRRSAGSAFSHRIEHRDCQKAEEVGRLDCSGEPPSNRTSPSRGIRLYGSGTSRWAAPRPFDALVKRASLGVPAMAENADEGVVDALSLRL